MSIAVDSLIAYYVVLHHVSTLARRVMLLSELLRVARPGGRVFVQVCDPGVLPCSLYH